MNSFHDPGMEEGRIFGIIKERPKHPRRQREDIIDTTFMRDIHHMGNGQFFTDKTLDGFLGILNYKYRYKMDFSNTQFLVSAREKDYNQRFISLVMRLRIKRKTIFDLDNYFVLNHIPPLHWGVIHVLPKQKCIVCFDGLHGEEHDKYEEVEK